MSLIRVGISGANGRMGKALEAVIDLQKKSLNLLLSLREKVQKMI